MNITAAIHAQLEAHAREQLPNECCGIIGTVDGRPASFYPARNLFESPMRFELHPSDMYAIYTETERRGEEMGILFHSHPKTEGRPSQTDINMNAKIAEVWGGLIWLIASLAGDAFVLRGFRIEGSAVEEVELVVG